MATPPSSSSPQPPRRPAASSDPSKPESPFEGLRVWALVGTVGWQAATPMVVFGIGGALLDQRWHTAPLLTLLGCILAIAVAYLLLKRTVQRTQQLTEAALRNRDRSARDRDRNPAAAHDHPTKPH